MDSRQLEREVRLLKFYLALVTVTLVISGIFGAVTRAQDQRQKFTEIDVERINVVERDGRLRLTISNRERSPGPVLNGKTLKRIGGNPPGLIFSNDEGEERLSPSTSIVKMKSFGSRIQKTPKVVNDPPSEAEMTRMIEQETRLRALPPGDRQTAMAQRMKEMEALCVSSACGAARVFTGKTMDRSAVVLLSDAVGRPRLRMVVTAQGAASLDFLDESGRVTESVPSKR